MALTTHLNQKKAIRTQSEMLADQGKTIEDLQNYARNVLGELQRVNGQLAHYQNTEYRRRHIEQTYDFAINSLPFWNRSPRAIMKRAEKFFAKITAETNELVEADKILYLSQLEEQKKNENLDSENSEDHSVNQEQN